MIALVSSADSFLKGLHECYVSMVGRHLIGCRSVLVRMDEAVRIAA